MSHTQSSETNRVETATRALALTLTWPCGVLANRDRIRSPLPGRWPPLHALIVRNAGIDLTWPAALARFVAALPASLRRLE